MSTTYEPDTYEPDEWVVEPSNITIIHCINSINIANVEPNKCGGTGTKAVLVNQTGITGNVALTPGFNCAITERNNVFTIEGIVGGGACLTENYCGGSGLLDVSDDCVMCNETVKAINGVGGKTISIKGGAGVSVTTEGNVVTVHLETQQFKNGCNT